ncbi:MAG: TetR/AcrR family transcriptional regulator [Chloroflexi bacterium]|nr:TetR/AcrR family transcriptional regulator [Chloroflexota bacterium]
MSAAVARLTADERREEIILAAFAEFADTGLEGTSTETIARRAGISQPYLFRLFGTKKELFLAAVERCLEESHEGFRRAIDEGDPEQDVLERLAKAYMEVIGDRRRLRMQMQAYAACYDPDVRRVVRRGFGRLVEQIRAASKLPPDRLASFIGQGMLLNVMASMDLLESDEPWVVQLREGCIGKPS